MQLTCLQEKHCNSQNIAEIRTLHYPIILQMIILLKQREIHEYQYMSLMAYNRNSQFTFCSWILAKQNCNDYLHGWWLRNNCKLSMWVVNDSFVACSQADN